MSHFEVEVKTLLGEEIQAQRLKSAMKKLDPSCSLKSKNRQLNHYFTGGDTANLYNQTKHFFQEEQLSKLRTILERATELSIRSRQKDDEVFLVIKASIDEGSSANTVKRMEFEEAVNVRLAELDELLLATGFNYLSKWSREREEYDYKGVAVCIDRNGGYGYVAEFEKIVHDESLVNQVRLELTTLMEELGLEEFDQGRLARMFDFYNQNWADYYGNNKTFIIT